MYKQSGRVLRNSEGRVFRFVDSSIFTISMNAVNKGVEFRFTTAADAVVKIGFGDGMSFSTTTVANIEKVISHGYTNIVGQTFKITLDSTSTILSFYPNANIVDVGSIWYKILSSLRKLTFYANTLKFSNIKSILDRDIYVDYVFISYPINIDIDISKLHFLQSVTGIVLYNTILMGKSSYINLYEYSSYQQLQLINVGGGTALINLKNLIDKSPKLNNVSVSNVYDTINRENVGLINLSNRHFNSFSLSYNTRYYGDYTNFVRLFNDPLSIGNLSFNQNSGGGMYCYINELTGDYYEKNTSTGFTGVVGDVTSCSFKFKTTAFLTDFASSAFGNLNNIANLKPYNANNEITYLSLTLSNNIEFDVSILGNHQCKVNTVLRIYYGNNLYGDISNLYLQNKSQTYDIAGINSSRVTGWVALIDNIYANKSTFNTTSKTFNCPNVMKAALTGTYQAPPGFVKGSADGTPTTSREKIFVLVNNYNWTFTNI